jgi:hypothetical protein
MVKFHYYYFLILIRYFVNLNVNRRIMKIFIVMMNVNRRMMKYFFV